MKTTILLCAALITCIPIARSQQKLPVVKATSATVSIRDGSILKQHYWQLDPGMKPDIYFADLPRKNHTVTFITDIDSISIPVTFGGQYDFVVLLNGKDSCFTRIVARYNGVFNPIKKNSASTLQPDTIPFTLEKSRIRLIGTVNSKNNIAIQLDLGAGTSCVNIKSVRKTAVKFNSTTIVSNTNGVQNEPSSNDNTLELGNLKWEHIPVVQVRNMDNDEDMIIGNSLFQDKTIEINYDKQVLIVHHQPIQPPPGYSSYAVLYDQHRPKIRISLNIAGQLYTSWFLFDTGRDGTMLIGDDFTGAFDVWKKFRSVFKLGTKKIVIIPEVKIAGVAFPDVVTNANDPAHPNGKQSLIGNELLNQFNLVLDNRNGLLYLKPNMLQGGYYSNWATVSIKCYGIISGAVIILSLLTWLLYKLIRKRKKRVFSRD
jgi:hypothetical protein